MIIRSLALAATGIKQPRAPARRSPAGDGLQHEEPVAGLEGHIVIHDRRDVVVVVEEEQMLPQAHRLVVKMGTQPRIGVQLLK